MWEQGKDNKDRDELKNEAFQHFLVILQISFDILALMWMFHYVSSSGQYNLWRSALLNAHKAMLERLA